MKRAYEINEAVRVAQVRQLFEGKYPDPVKRTEDTVLHFFGWLEHWRKELLSKEQGDPYQLLKSDLNGLYPL